MAEKAHAGKGELVDKFNHGLDKEVSTMVHDYDALHTVDAAKQINIPNEREQETTKIRRGLEGILGTGSRDRHKAIEIMGELVSKAYEMAPRKEGEPVRELPKNLFLRRKEISDYLTPTGVTYETLVKEIVNQNGPVDVEKLPDDNPLKRVINYVVTKSHTGQEKVQFLQQTLVDIGDAKAPAVATEFNKYGLNLDPRYAKPQDVLRAYGLLVQSRIAAYQANDPTKVHNKQKAA